MKTYKKKLRKNKVKTWVEKLLIYVFVFVGMIAVLNWSIGVFVAYAEFRIEQKKVIERNIDDARVEEVKGKTSTQAPVSFQSATNIVSDNDRGGEIPAPSDNIRKAVATTYNAEVGQTDADPLTMASGKKVYEGAVASNCYKIGTKLEIEGKVYVVEDRMNKRYTALCGTDDERLDVFKWDRKDNFKKNVEYTIK